MPSRREYGIPRKSQPDHGRFPAVPYHEFPITAQIHELRWRRFWSGAGRLKPRRSAFGYRIPGRAAPAAIPPVPPGPGCRGRPAPPSGDSGQARPNTPDVCPSVRNVPIRPTCRRRLQ